MGTPTLSFHLVPQGAFTRRAGPGAALSCAARVTTRAQVQVPWSWPASFDRGRVDKRLLPRVLCGRLRLLGQGMTVLNLGCLSSSLTFLGRCCGTTYRPGRPFHAAAPLAPLTGFVCAGSATPPALYAGWLQACGRPIHVLRPPRRGWTWKWLRPPRRELQHFACMRCDARAFGSRPNMRYDDVVVMQARQVTQAGSRAAAVG